jgi:hypothetical protein
MPLRWRSGLARATSTGSCTIPIEAANTCRSATRSARGSRSGHFGREPWRQLQHRAGRDDLRPLQDRADPSPWTVEGQRRRRVLDARVGRLVQPPPAPRTGRRRPAGRVRGRLPKEGGPELRCRTQGTEPPVNPGRFSFRRISRSTHRLREPVATAGQDPKARCNWLDQHGDPVGAGADVLGLDQFALALTSLSSASSDSTLMSSEASSGRWRTGPLDSLSRSSHRGV